MGILNDLSKTALSAMAETIEQERKLLGKLQEFIFLGDIAKSAYCAKHVSMCLGELANILIESMPGDYATREDAIQAVLDLATSGWNPLDPLPDS